MIRRFRALSFFCCIVVFLNISLTKQEVSAHSGGTDSQGGHHDYNNVSGLGAYHYHHGMGPHLHPNGICPYSPKDTIKVLNMPSTMDVGNTTFLLWETTYYSGNGSVEWVSSNSDIIRVSQQGVLEAKNPGRVIITAKLHNGLRSFNVTSREVNASSINITNKLTRTPIGNSVKLAYKQYPLNTTTTNTKWESSNPQVASIDRSGVLRAINSGITVISVSTNNGKRDQFELEVFEMRPISIKTNHDNLNLILGESAELIVEVIPKSTTNKSVTWGKYDSSIISVKKDGTIIANSIGTTTLLLTCQHVSKEITVEVLPVEVSKILIDKNSIPYHSGENVNVGATFAPELLIEPFNATDKTYVLSTDNSSIFSISGTSVRAIKSGEGKIIVTSGGAQDELYLRVVNDNLMINYIIWTIISITVAAFFIIGKRKQRA